MKKKKIAVLGAGSWGTTLAILLSDENDIFLWEFMENEAEILIKDRENKKFLPGLKFPDNLTVTNDLHEAVNDAFLIVFAMPSFALRTICEKVKTFITKDQLLVTVIKGIEDNTFYQNVSNH